MGEIEKIWTQEGIDQARDQLRSASARIEEAIARAAKMAEDAELEVREINKKILPGLLVKQFLGEKISKGEVEKLKKARERRVELREVLEDHPLLHRGLESEPPRLNSIGREITKRERHVQSYEKIKNSLKDRYSPTLAQDLLDKAKFLSCEFDAVQFLKDLKEN
ncbi:MAG: hypothetical protein FJ107_05130 [Deltaproteobacteria bacterium]|nr:hypothetical protein [Deltaproteobacteria bacterium]